MNDIPRHKLREIIQRYGLTLVDDPRRVRALLLDLCGQYRREIFVLVQAQEDGVAEDLLEVPDSIPLEMLVSQLTHRLVENRALSQDAARWSVESWAYALDKPIIFTNVSPNESVGDAQHKPLGLAKSALPSQSRKTATQSQSVTYNADLAVDYYWRERDKPESAWVLLGQTPGKIRLPDNGVLKLCPHIAGEEFTVWAGAFPYADQVEVLELDKPVSDTIFLALQTFSNVSELTVDNGEPLSDLGFDHLRVLHLLKTLKLTWCTSITDEGFENLASLNNLEDVKIEWTHISDHGLRAFESLPALGHLGLRECKELRGDGLHSIQKNIKIQSLDLAGATNMVDAGMHHIGEMTQLHKLNLSHCSRITGLGLSKIRHLTKLSQLSLAWMPGLDDSTLAVVAALPQLISLGMSHSIITNTGLTQLRDMPSLAYLDLSGCDYITDRGLRSLQHLPSLTHLNLSVCKRLTSKGIDRLAKPGLSILR